MPSLEWGLMLSLLFNVFCVAAYFEWRSDVKKALRFVPGYLSDIQGLAAWIESEITPDRQGWVTLGQLSIAGIRGQVKAIRLACKHVDKTIKEALQ